MDKTKEAGVFLWESADSGQDLPKANRKYKDTLFRMLFREKKNLLELYNALCGTFYVDESELEIVTLEKLEPKVLVLNIRPGYNTGLSAHCRTLREYIQYVEKVRGYVKEMSVENAVDRAVTECIRENILSSFLEKYRREVIQMSIFEYDEEKELQLIRQDERQQGIKIGMKQGEEGKLKEQIKKKIAKGKSIAEIAEDLEESIEVIRALC